MKKIYTTLMVALLGTSAFAQSSMLAIPGGTAPHNQVQRNVNPSSTQATQSIYVDYDYMDEDFQTNTQGLSYSRYIWELNSRNGTNAGDTSSILEAIVDFNELFDSYTTGYPAVAFTTFNTYNVDSIFLLCGHENNSGTNDTLIVKIVSLTGAGYPTTSVLHVDTIITNTGLSTGNDWLTTAVVGLEPNYMINNNTTKFAVRVEYYGSRLDTFGLIAGFGDLGAGNCASVPQLNNFAVESEFSTNSYRFDPNFSYTYGILPTSTGADTFYDCDGDGQLNLTVDSDNFLQNWGIWVRLTLDGVGVAETNGNVGVGQNMPNPFNGETTIPFSLKNGDDVTLTICDVTGKQVLVQTKTAAAGQNSFVVASTDLAAGVYYYTVQSGADRVTRKMVVAE